MAVDSSQGGGFFGPGLARDTPIYRIYPQKYLGDLLAGKFVIRSTRTWTDPYENIASQCVYNTLENGRIKQYSIEGNWLPTFGQCWSTTRESDAGCPISRAPFAREVGLLSFPVNSSLARFSLIRL